MLAHRYFVRRPIVPRPIYQAAGAAGSSVFPFHKVHHHRLGPSRGRTTSSRLGVFLAVGLSGGIMALVGAALAAGLAQPKSSENVLHPEKTSSKLMTTSAQAAPVPEPRPPAPRLAPVFEEKTESPPPAIVVPIVPAPAPLVVPQPPQAPAAPPLAEQSAVPVAESPAPPPASPAAATDPWQPPLVFSKAHGETPMLRNWNMIKLASALAAAMTVTPVAFAGDDKGDAKDKALEKLHDKIDKLNTKIADAFDRYGKDLGSLRKDFDDLRTLVLAKETAADNLEKRIAKLSIDLDALRKKMSEGTTSLYPPDKQLDDIRAKMDEIMAKLDSRTSKYPDQNGNVGQVVLANLYPQELLFIVNGKEYRVQPNQRLVLRGVPPGPLVYEVASPTLGLVVPRRTTGVNPNETLTLTAQ